MPKKPQTSNANSLSEFGARLVALCDGRAGLRGGMHMDVREPAQPCSDSAPPATASVLEFIASDETLDRYDEIIQARGWKLENYQRNPVFQNAHNYGDIIFTLGKALLTEVRDGRLYQRIEFATEVNPMAKVAYGLYRGKFLNAVSVGFIPLRWENGGAEAGYQRKYIEQELLEVSAVGIPANPNALQLGLKAGVIEKCDLAEWLEMLRQLCDSDWPPRHSEPPQDNNGHEHAIASSNETHLIVPGARAFDADLWQLARDISQLIKRA